MQKVVYWHECGHIALAHLDKGQITVEQEQDADCFGVRAALTLGQIQFSDVAKIQREFSALGSGDSQHLSGSSRSVNLMRCLGEEPKWAQCKKRYYDNLNAIEQSIPTIQTLQKKCSTMNSGDCTQARTLANQLHSGFLKEIANLDHECPFILDPRFSKVMHDYQTAQQLLGGQNERK